MASFSARRATMARVLAGQKGRLDPLRAQAFHAHPVAHREPLERLAMLGEEDPTVGEDAVDVGDHQPQPARSAGAARHRAAAPTDPFHLRSPCGPSSVDGQIGPGHVARGVAGQKDDRAPVFVGLRHPPERGPRAVGRDKMAVLARRADPPRRQTVDPHAAIGPVGGQKAGEGQDGALAGGYPALFQKLWRAVGFCDRAADRARRARRSRRC